MKKLIVILIALLALAAPLYAAAPAPVSAIGVTNGTATVEAGRFLKFQDPNLVLATVAEANAASDSVIGVCTQAGITGTSISYAPPGMVTTVVCGSAFLPGTPLVSDANGAAVAWSGDATTNATICGIALQAGTHRTDANFAGGLYPQILVVRVLNEQRRIITGYLSATTELTSRDANVTRTLRAVQIADANVAGASNVLGTAWLKEANVVGRALLNGGTVLLDGNFVTPGYVKGGAASFTDANVTSILRAVTIADANVAGTLKVVGATALADANVTGRALLNGGTVLLDGNFVTPGYLKAATAAFTDANVTGNLRVGGIADANVAGVLKVGGSTWLIDANVVGRALFNGGTVLLDGNFVTPGYIKTGTAAFGDSNVVGKLTVSDSVTITKFLTVTDSNGTYVTDGSLRNATAQADANVLISVPFIIEVNEANNQVTQYTIPTGKKLRIHDIALYKVGAGVDANAAVASLTVSSSGNAITNAINVGALADKARAAPSTIDQAYKDIAAAGLLRITAFNAEGACSACRVVIWCSWIAP